MADGSEILKLAAEFDAVTHDDWLAQVHAVLGDKSLDHLASATPDAIALQPLYVRQDVGPVAQFPGDDQGRRASNPAGCTRGWDVRQQHGLWSTEAALNAAILTDLERGVTSIELLAVDDADLDAVLTGVHLDLAPVAFCGGGTSLARRFLALAAQREVDTTALSADLGCDPIGQFAAARDAGLEFAEALKAAALLGAEVANTHPGVRTFRADGLVFADAGATPATELGAIVSCAVTYLRALVDAGLDTQRALSQILLRAGVGTDQFGDIAKLRALRVMWGRVIQASGVQRQDCTVQAGTSCVSSTTVDPWMNMLRATVGCFSAAVGGADIVTIAPFDAGVGVPDELGLRTARNTQLALMEESNLHRVIDPGGGSWYLETLTDQLADAGWEVFQRFEEGGGVAAALASGELQSRIAEQAAQQTHLVSTRRRTLVGANRFANLDESVRSRARYPQVPEPPAGATVEPLVERRLSAGFEQLRDNAGALAQRPLIFLANLGPPSAHSVRSGWATDFFAAGAIGVVSNDGFDDPEALALAFRAEQCALAVLCSSDEIYLDWAVQAAEALVGAGAKLLYLVGRPGPRQSSYEAAGVHEFIYVGCDALATLNGAHAALSLAPNGVGP